MTRSTAAMTRGLLRAVILAAFAALGAAQVQPQPPGDTVPAAGKNTEPYKKVLRTTPTTTITTVPANPAGLKKQDRPIVPAAPGNLVRRSRLTPAG